MTLVTDPQRGGNGSFSAELSQSNGVTDKIDIEVEKLIVSAERTQDLVTGWCWVVILLHLPHEVREILCREAAAGEGVTFSTNTPPKSRVHEVVCTNRD